MVRDFILCLWQLPQNLLAGVIILIYRATKLYSYMGSDIYTVKRFFDSGISLGKYIIVQQDRATDDTIKHEAGHSIQSRWLGPLYLFVVGLPSIVRNIYDRLFHKNMLYYDRVKWYYSGFPEAQADKLGGVKRF